MLYSPCSRKPQGKSGLHVGSDTVIRVAVLGAGGFAREVAEILSSGLVRGASFHGFVTNGAPDSTASLKRVVGNDSWLDGQPHSLAQILGVGTPALRAKLLHRFIERPSDSWITVVHPMASLSPSVIMKGRSLFIGSGVTVSTDVQLGEGSVVLWNATVGHDSVIEDCACVYPGSNLGGGVRIGQQATVGSGAQILPGRRVGDYAVVGSGAVVTRDVPDGETVVGVPARSISRQ